VQLVTFRLGTEEFGLDVFAVHEILRYTEPTPVPRAPAFVEGVMDVRGTLVPVVDLRRRFELPNAETGEDTRIVLVEFGGERLGLVVDAVSEVMRVPETAIQPPPRYIRGLAAEYVRGMARLEGRLVVLLEMDRILSSEERIALEQTSLAGGDDALSAEASPSSLTDAASGAAVADEPAATEEADASADASEDGTARRGGGRSRG
jgi:purine-binding chemotaxis protein CheW